LKKEEQLLNEIIQGYRKVLDDRYQHASLQDKYTLPKSLTPERLILFKTYFLNYIYPPVEKRAILNDAFEELDYYVKHPEKLLRLMLDAKSLLFKHGRHLPKILYTGLKALKSFRMASDLEHRLSEEAILHQIDGPVDKLTIAHLMKLIPRSDLEKFIANGQSLFEILYDKPLVENIQDVLEQLIINMKNRPTLYSNQVIKGMEMGLEIIKKGHQLFYQLSVEEQKEMMHFIVKLERDAISDGM
jgi:hypothetical protein